MVKFLEISEVVSGLHGRKRACFSGRARSSRLLEEETFLLLEWVPPHPLVSPVTFSSTRPFSLSFLLLFVFSSSFPFHCAGHNQRGERGREREKSEKEEEEEGETGKLGKTQIKFAGCF